MIVGKSDVNLLNDCKTNILRLCCSKFLALGNGDDNDIPKLLEECLRLKLFDNVLMVLVSINKLLILLGKDNRLVSEKKKTVVHTHR